MAYVELNKANFKETISNGVTLVDFWAPWCAPCRMLSPIIEKLAEEYSGRVNVCKLNTDDEQEIASQYGIRSIPTIIFFKNGDIASQVIGVVNEKALKEKLDALL